MYNLVILDNGHGNDTPGKRSPIYDGKQLFEYEFNRDVVARINKYCAEIGIKTAVLVPELNDITLAERCRRANTIYRQNNKCFLLSIHANAGGGTGFEVFTSVGKTKADEIAETLCNDIAKYFPKFRLRTDKTDGDSDKESNFYILKHTICPAVLAENLFMDNYNDFKSLINPDFRDKLAIMYVDFIKKMI